MRAIVVILALAAVASAQVLMAGLSAEQRAAIETTNSHHVEKLDIWTHKRANKFLAAVKAADITIRLGHGIQGGHSIMYEFVEGPKGAHTKIAEIARANGLQVVPSRTCKCKACCGRILLPGKDVKIVEAKEIAGTRQGRSKNTTNTFEPLKNLNHTAPHEMTVQEAKDKKRTQYRKLSADQKQWYHDNNLAQISKMNIEAQPFIRKFAEDLRAKAPKTVLHFMRPIQNGYSVRFTHVEGPLGPVRRWASQCGLVLKGRTLTAPKGGAHTAEEVKDAKSHIEVDTPEQSKAGVPEPLSTQTADVPGIGGRVPVLEDKWIETKPKAAFLEEDDSLMELFEQADRAADVLSDAEEF